MLKVRKRRKGGGRKAKGPITGKSEVFSTRITPETRQALEREAKASTYPISQMAEILLREGLRERQRAGRDKATRSLCYLIMEAAKYTSDGDRNWTSDVGLRSAFLRSVDGIITMLGHAMREQMLGESDEGLMERPFEHPAFKTSEDLARATVLRVGSDLIEARSEPHSRFRLLGDPTRWLDYRRRSWKEDDMLKSWTAEHPSATEQEIREARRQIKNEVSPDRAVQDQIGRFWAVRTPAKGKIQMDAESRALLREIYNSKPLRGDELHARAKEWSKKADAIMAKNAHIPVQSEVSEEMARQIPYTPATTTSNRGA